MSSSQRKEVERIIKKCKKKGLKVVFRNGHYKVYCSNGKMITVSSTPRCCLTIKTIRADFKRNGIII